jgi:hypothetical protein
MTSPAVKLIVRCIRVAPVLSLMFAGCTCSDGSQDAPAALAAPTAIVLPTEPSPAAQPPAGAPQPTASEVSATVAPTALEAAGAAASATRGDCERYIGAITGREEDKTLLKDPAVHALALQVPDLITCLAVKNDSEAMCDLLIATQSAGQKRYTSKARDCLYTQAMYHEARTYPKSTSFLFHEMEWRQCDGRKVCEALREATRTGDETKCAEAGPFQSICRAYVKLDTSLCRVEGKLPQRKGDEGADAESAVAENCKKTIESRRFLAGGLKKSADSGSENERALAQAALGQADACKQYEKAAIDMCLAKSSSATSGGAPPAPAAPAPVAPAPATPAAEMSPTAGSQPGSAQT